MAAIKLIDLNEDNLTVNQEPLCGYSTRHIRLYLAKELPDVKLAAVLARVSAQCRWLGQQISLAANEEEEDNFVAVHGEWWGLEKEVASHIIRRTEASAEGRAVNNKNDGLYCAVRPFMERNGYKNVGGRWLKDRR